MHQQLRDHEGLLLLMLFFKVQGLILFKNNGSSVRFDSIRLVSWHYARGKGAVIDRSAHPITHAPRSGSRRRRRSLRFGSSAGLCPRDLDWSKSNQGKLPVVPEQIGKLVEKSEGWFNTTNTMEATGVNRTVYKRSAIYRVTLAD